jgi:citrate synthase
MTEQYKNIGLRGVTVADSRISMVDGAQGKLIYRGFTIQQLADQASFEEVVYLLLNGDPPTEEQLAETKKIMAESRNLPEGVLAGLKARQRTAIPMDVLQGAVTALADHDPDLGTEDREKAIHSCLRLISQTATVVAAWHQIRRGFGPIVLNRELSHAGAFLQGLWGTEPTAYEERLMDLLLVLHAEHTLNASTFAAREVASTLAHLYASVSAGVGALSGPLHGGANARVMDMLLEIGSIENVEPWVSERIAKNQRIMGLGHAVYKTEDPRAGVLREVAEKTLVGREEEKWFRLALEIERVGRQQLRDKKGLDLYPNVDFYSGPVLYALGLPTDMFPPFFAVSRVSGWAAHYVEEHFAEAQPKPALYRPRANYTGRYCGPEGCTWVPLRCRGHEAECREMDEPHGSAAPS